MIIMVIQDNGKTIKNKEKVAIFIQMVKNMMGNGLEIKNLETVHINIRMVIFILEVGKMIEDQVKVK
jgi:hypothetical protein